MESIAYKVAIVNVQGATSYALFTNAFRSYQVDFEIDRSPNSSEKQSFEFELKTKKVKITTTTTTTDDKVGH